MNKEAYLAKMKNFQEKILTFLESDNDWKDDFNEFKQFLIQEKFKEQNDYLHDVLHLISKISNNHQRGPNFIVKIEQVLLFLKEDINSSISNTSLFNLFKCNKRILLFLFKEKMIAIDNDILSIMSNSKHTDYFYPDFFMPEIISFYSNGFRGPSESSFDEFEKKRQIGENDSNICQLIRNDSIDDFIVYFNKNNLKPSSKITKSIFETNSFLLNQGEITIFEYAIFCGAKKIATFLNYNKAEITPSLMNFAVHSNNPEIIHFVEENLKTLDENGIGDDFYIKMMDESIKCYHNDVAKYIQVTYLQIHELEKEEEDEEKTKPKLFGFLNPDYVPSYVKNMSIVKYIQNTYFQNQNEKDKSMLKFFGYYNFEFIPDEFNNETALISLVMNDYLYLVKILYNDPNLNINAVCIL